MKETPDVDMTAQRRALAARMGCDFAALTKALECAPLWSSPGKIVDGEKPLGVGTLLNLRRGHPSGQHPDDLRWYVAGYKRRRRDGRWEGYVLVRAGVPVTCKSLGRCITVTGSILTTTASDCEAFDVLDRLTFQDKHAAGPEDVAGFDA